MADAAGYINLATSDPNFGKLPPEDQKAILQHLSSLGGGVAPKGDYSKLVTPESQDPTKSLPPDTSGQYQRTQGANSTNDFLIENLRSILPKAAAVAASPYGGPVSSVPAYLGTDALLQKMKSNPQEQSFASRALGFQPGGAASTITNSGEQAAILGASEKIISGVWRGLSAFKDVAKDKILDYLPTASQALKASGQSPTMASVLKFVEDHFAPGTKAAALERSGGAATDIGEKLVAKTAGRSVATANNPQDMAELISSQIDTRPGASLVSTPKTPAQIDSLIANKTQLESAIKAAQTNGVGTKNITDDLAGFRLSRILQNSTTDTPSGGKLIDPQKLYEQFHDPELTGSHKLLFGKDQSNIEQFFRNVSAAQEKSGSSSSMAHRLLWYDVGAATASLPMSMFTGNLIPAGVAATGISMQVGMSQLAKLLTEPSTARLMLNLANGSALGVSERYAARAITNTLKNSIVQLTQPDGSKTQVTLTKDGKLVPVE